MSEPVGAVPAPVTLREFNVTIASTGRGLVLATPLEVTEAELVEFAGWILTALIPGLRADRERGAAARIVLPVGVRPP